MIGEGVFKAVPSGGGGGPVTFDNSQFTGGVASGASTSFTVGSGTQRALVVILLQNTGVFGGSSVTYNGVSMTGIGADGTVFGLVAPASGANNIVATFTGGGTVSLAALSTTGTDQSGGTTTFHDYATNSAISSSPSVTITSATNELAIAGWLNAAAQNFTVPAVGCVDIGKVNTGVNQNASSYAVGAASVSVGYAMGSSTFWVGYGCAIKSA
jgi:hypothetical protein